MSVTGLTHMQRACLTLIQGMETEGLSPSFDELRTGLGLSSKGEVSRLLHALKDKGCVDWLPNRARSIRIVHQDWSAGALSMAPTEDLERLVATAAGLIAHRKGGEATFELFDRIGRRVSGRPVGDRRHA